MTADADAVDTMALTLGRLAAVNELWVAGRHEHDLHQIETYLTETELGMREVDEARTELMPYLAMADLAAYRGRIFRARRSRLYLSDTPPIQDARVLVSLGFGSDTSELFLDAHADIWEAKFCESSRWSVTGALLAHKTLRALGRTSCGERRAHLATGRLWGAERYTPDTRASSIAMEIRNAVAEAKVRAEIIAHESTFGKEEPLILCAYSSLIEAIEPHRVLADDLTKGLLLVLQRRADDQRCAHAVDEVRSLLSRIGLGADTEANEVTLAAYLAKSIWGREIRLNNLVRRILRDALFAS